MLPYLPQMPRVKPPYSKHWAPPDGTPKALIFTFSKKETIWGSLFSKAPHIVHHLETWLTSLALSAISVMLTDNSKCYLDDKHHDHDVKLMLNSSEVGLSTHKAWPDIHHQEVIKQFQQPLQTTSEICPEIYSILFKLAYSKCDPSWSWLFLRLMWPDVSSVLSSQFELVPFYSKAHNKGR